MLESFSGEVNQAQLAQWLETFTPESGNEDDDLNLVWLDGGWRTYPAPLREPGYNVTALLEQDLYQIERLPAQDIPKFTVPIPATGWKPKKKYKFYPVATSDIWSYTQEIGAKKRGGNL